MKDASPSLPPAALLLQLISGRWISQAIAAAANLDIASLLADGPKTPAEIAAASGAHAPSVFRLLRSLASVGVFAEDDAGRFANTPLSTPLRGDVLGSLRGMARYTGAQPKKEDTAEVTKADDELPIACSPTAAPPSAAAPPKQPAPTC